MNTYIAFLRGINVGGRNLIKMDTLRAFFAELGFKNVRTYIQSGNVVFESASTNATALERKIENKLKERLGQQVSVIVRTLPDLTAAVKRNPFKKFDLGADVATFVVLIDREPKTKQILPLISTKENLEVFQIRNGVAFVIARRKQDGRCGFPNAFVEKQLGVIGTTRNWSTLNKIVQFAETIDTNVVKRKKS